MSAFNLLLENLDPLAQLLLQALLRTLWQGMLIAGLVWILLRIFKQVSATTRHAVWLASLLIISALPFIAIATSKNVTPQTSAPTQLQRPVASNLMPSAIPPVTYPQNSVEQISEQFLPSSAKKQISVRTFTDLEQAVVLEEARKTVTLSESASVSRIATPQAPTIKQTPSGKQNAGMSFWQRASDWFFDSRLPLALVILWLLISALMLGRLAHSYHVLLNVRRLMQPAEEFRQKRVEHLTAHFGVRRFVLLFTSTQVKVPMTVGALKPVIVMPPHLADNLSDSEFDSIAAHELAHIRRWDYLTNLLQRFAQAFLFSIPQSGSLAIN